MTKIKNPVLIESLQQMTAVIELKTLFEHPTIFIMYIVYALCKYRIRATDIQSIYCSPLLITMCMQMNLF